MSTYALNKMIRDINRDPDLRAACFEDPASFAHGYALNEEERRAFVDNDLGALYKFGVHGLILKPYSMLLKVPEPVYLSAIRS